MADEKTTDRNQPNQQEQGKAMGATANAGQDQRTNSPSETAGQGGGIQGSGQSQQNPGGFTGGEESSRDGSRDGSRDDSQSNQASTERRPDPTQGE